MALLQYEDVGEHKPRGEKPERKATTEQHAREPSVTSRAHHDETPGTARLGQAQRSLRQQRAAEAQLHEPRPCVQGVAERVTQTLLVETIDEMLDAAHLRAERSLDLRVGPTDLVQLAEQNPLAGRGTAGALVLLVRRGRCAAMTRDRPMVAGVAAAMVAFAGMPSVSSGMNDEVAAAFGPLRERRRLSSKGWTALLLA